MLHSPSSQTRMPRAFLRGGGRHLSQTFSTPQVRYVFLSTTLCFLYRISFTNGSVYQGYCFGFSAQFGLATHFSLGGIPPLRRGSADSSKQRLEGFCATAGTFLPLTKGSNRGSTSVRHRARLFQPLLPHTKRDGGLRPILDLGRLNLSLYKGKFKMLTLKTIMSQIQGGDWFVTIDLKDAYFHIQVVRRHRKFLRFAFGGKANQYKVLPFGLALAPRTITKCMDAALAL